MAWRRLCLRLEAGAGSAKRSKASWEAQGMVRRSPGLWQFQAILWVLVDFLVFPEHFLCLKGFLWSRMGLPKANVAGFRVMSLLHNSCIDCTYMACKRSPLARVIIIISWSSLIVARTTLRGAAILDCALGIRSARPLSDQLARWRVGIRAKRPGGI